MAASSSGRTDVERTALWVLAITSIAAFMSALDALVVSTALDSIKQHLHASVGDLEWTLNAYTLTLAVLLMSASALGDRFGRRRLFTIGLVLFAAASAACALAPNIGWLIAARAVQGVGSALVAPTGLALLTTAITPERRGWALGIFASIIGLAVLGGPVVGGAITQGLDWEWIFWLNVPIAVVMVLLTVRQIPESQGPASRMDLSGLALITLASLGIVWGLVRGNTSGWESAEVLGTLIGGSVVFVGFIVWELRCSDPMLPMRLFASPAFAAGNAVSFLLFASNFSTVFFMAQFQQVALGHGPLAAGVRLLPWTAPLFLVSPRAGKLSDHIGERPLVIGGLLLQAVGMGWIALVASPYVAYAGLIAPMVISATGIAFAMPAVQKAVVGSVAPADIGKASGTYNTTRWFGAVFGVAILVAVFTGTGSYESPGSFSNGFAWAIATSSGLAVVGAIVGTALPRRAAVARRSAPRPCEYPNLNVSASQPAERSDHE